MFAGRGQEMERLTRGLRAAASGRTAAFALVGEPGIGKTRLATELSAQAAALGFRVGWGRAWEAGGAPALWPWRQLLEAAEVPAALDGVTATLGSREFPVSDPEQARFAQFQRVAQALKQACAEAPLLCVLDDLHAADLASIELATFLLRALRTQRLCVVLTYRDREAAAPALRDVMARLAREVEVLGLERLSADESAALVQEAMGDGGRSVAPSLYRATSGNPLFLLETLRSVALHHSNAASLEQLPVADGIQAVVRQRTARLEAGHRMLLSAASAIGREGTLELWAAVTGAQATAFEPIFATGLVARASPATFSFSHALVRDAVYLELTAEDRAALHDKLARVMDARVVEGQRRWIEPRAHHALLAAKSVASERVVAWVLEAASALRERAAWEEAVTLLTSARATILEPSGLVAELALALGWALGDAGQADAMRDCFRAVIPHARAQQDAPLFARAVLGLGAHYRFGDTQTELIALIDEAVATLATEHHALHARLTARKAAAMTPAPVGESALKLARAAVREVRATDDLRAQLDVAVAAGSAMGDFAPADERLGVNTDLVRLAHQLGEPVLELRGVSRLATDHFELADLPRADACLLEREALVKALQLPRLDATSPLFTSMRAMGAGDFATCDAGIEKVRATADATNDSGLKRTLALHVFWLALLRDDSAAVAAALPEVLRAAASIPSFSTMLTSAAHAQRGDADAVRRELDPFDARLSGLHSTMGLATIAHAALVGQSTAHAHTAFELLAPRAHLNANWGLFGLVFGPPVAMTLGALAAARGDESAARTYFEQAHARAKQLPMHEAWVCFYEGTQPSLARAAELAATLGMKGLVARAQAKLNGAPARPKPPSSDGPELSVEAQGADWLVKWGARQVLVPNLKGMPMLATLVAQPHQDIHALTLVGEGEGIADAGDSGELLDDEAKAAYRARMKQLQDELEEAQELGNDERAEDAREELDALGRELSRAVGLGGRDRRGNANAERARIAARRRLRDAIARISQGDKELGKFLEGAIRTGAFCCYAPQRRPV